MSFRFFKRSDPSIRATQGRVVFLRKEVSMPPWLRRSVEFFKIHPVELGILFVFALLIYSFTVRGSSLDFHPATCIGSWQNPEQAQGTPDLDAGSAAEQFTSGNSALFTGGNEQIFCNGFAGNWPEPPAEPKKAVLTLSLAVKKPELPKEAATVTLPEEASATPQLPESLPDLNIIFETSSVEAAPTPASAEPSVPPAENSASPAVTPAPPVETPSPVPAPEEKTNNGQSENNQPAPSVEPLTPQSFRLIPIAFAQEAEGGSTTLAVTEALPVSDELARVYYSLDGVNWKLAGVLTNDNANKFELSLPFGEPLPPALPIVQPAEGEASSTEVVTPVAPVSDSFIRTWEDLKKLEIRVDASFFTLGDATQIYLDGMTLTVTYAEPEPKAVVVEEVVVPAEPAEPVAALPEQPAPEAPKEEPVPSFTGVAPFEPSQSDVIKRTFQVLGSGLSAKKSLPWQPIEVQRKIEREGSGSLGSASISAELSGEITISGTCKKDYYVIMIFPGAEDYFRAPRNAVYNSAVACNGSFSIPLSSLDLHLIPKGRYYLLVADLPEQGAWIPISEIVPIEIE